MRKFALFQLAVMAGKLRGTPKLMANRYKLLT